jgi:hypothetical protein
VLPPILQPEYFVDRSLGRIIVPRALRDAGLHVVTLAERYGIPDDEMIPDQRWLADAGRSGEIVLMKDSRVRYNAAEKAAVIEHKVRCFCLTRGSLTGSEMASRFLSNLARIELACQQSGPFIYAVHENRIERLDL